MNVFRDLKQWQTGVSEDGNPMFSIPLQSDEDGMIGRECPNLECEPRYFKIASHDDPEGGNVACEEGANRSDAALTCPYCGQQQDRQEFTTQAQIEWVKSMIVRSVHREFQRILAGAIRSTPRTQGGLFSVNLHYKPGPLPSVRHYAEEALKRIVTCDKCQRGYAVYGIAFHCPFCGEGNLLVHLQRSIDIIESLIAAGDIIRESGGEEAASHHLANCLEDVVSLFEGFLKQIYTRTIKDQHGAGADQYLRRIRTNFQRLQGAEDFFRDDLGVNLFATVSAQDRAFLEVQFAKRHVITHNLGLIDERFRQQAQSWQRQGTNVPLAPEDVRRALQIVAAVIGHAAVLI